MKDKAYLLCITLISFLPLCGMNDGKKRKMPVQNLKQSSMKKQKALLTIQQKMVYPAI